MTSALVPAAPPLSHQGCLLALRAMLVSMKQIVVVPKFDPVLGERTILSCAVVKPTEFIQAPSVLLVVPEVSLL